jgi:hypothetical protein
MRTCLLHALFFPRIMGGIVRARTAHLSFASVSFAVCSRSSFLNYVLSVFYSFSFCFALSVLFCSVLCCSVLCCSVLFCSVLFEFYGFFSFLFILFSFILFCFALLCSLLPALLSFTLLFLSFCISLSFSFSFLHFNNT